MAVLPVATQRASTTGAGPADGLIPAVYNQGPMVRHYGPAWLVATARPRRRPYDFRKKSGGLAKLAAIRRMLSFVRRFIDSRRWTLSQSR